MNNAMSFTAVAYSFRNSQAYLYLGTGYFCCDKCIDDIKTWVV